MYWRAVNSSKGIIAPSTDLITPMGSALSIQLSMKSSHFSSGTTSDASDLVAGENNINTSISLASHEGEPVSRISSMASSTRPSSESLACLLFIRVTILLRVLGKSSGNANRLNTLAILFPNCRCDLSLTSPRFGSNPSSIDFSEVTTVSRSAKELFPSPGIGIYRGLAPLLASPATGSGSSTIGASSKNGRCWQSRTMSQVCDTIAKRSVWATILLNSSSFTAALWLVSANRGKANHDIAPSSTISP